MNFLYRLPFYVLEVPNLKLKKPSWFVKPSAMVVFSMVLLSYFLMTGGTLNFFLIAVSLNFIKKVVVFLNVQCFRYYL